jgi:hypothetical protein
MRFNSSVLFLAAAIAWKFEMPFQMPWSTIFILNPVATCIGFKPDVHPHLYHELLDISKNFVINMFSFLFYLSLDLLLLCPSID